jgi:CMP-N-acetylneuraminic acid synthetase
VNKNLLAIIPARGGSKGLPNKNLLNLNGKPLIAWTIEAAQKCEFIDKILVSTDSLEIKEVSNMYGAETPFLRPKELSDDRALSIDVVLHAIQNFHEYQYVCMLQPTSPLRTEIEIEKAFKMLINHNANACVSVTESNQSPYWSFQISKDEKLKPLFDFDDIPLRRQELPNTYFLNGAIYIAKSNWLLNSRSFLTNETIAYVMSSDISIDIDTIDDFKLAENYLFNQNLSK